MKIKSVQISNVRCFPYVAQIENATKIEFDTNDSDVDILIGPNGSGKSTVIEVLNHIFTWSLFKKYTFTPTLLDNESQKDDVIRYINSENDPTFGYQNTLSKNYDSDLQQKEQKLLITLSLSDQDKKSIHFIKDNCGVIFDLLNKYTKYSDIIDSIDITGLLNDEVSLTFQRTDDKLFKLLSDAKSSLTMVYLEHFELFQKIIELHNELERRNGNNLEIWDPLFKSFGMISSYRNYKSFDLSLNLNKVRYGEIERKVMQNSSLSGNSDIPPEFEYVLYQIFDKYVDLMHSAGDEVADEKILQFDLYKNITENISEFLHLDCEIKGMNKLEAAYKIEFLRSSKPIFIKDLSAGEKAILHLIFALYGYDVSNGSLLIDEPELHLHPQWQKKYVQILEDEIHSDKSDAQLIMATHSPLFVTPKTIQNVHRFHIDGSEVKVKHNTSTSIDKHLINILSYTNSSKLFFVDKAILVEGPSDEIFWRWYLEKLSEENKNIKDYEIYDIGGKGNQKTWREFFESWGLNVCFIGDLDCISDYGILSENKIKELKNDYLKSDKLFLKIKKKVLDDSGSQDVKALLSELDKLVTNDFQNFNENSKSYLCGLWKYIIERFLPLRRNILSPVWEEVESKIKEKYKDGIYVFKEGSLEAYTGTSHSVQKVIDFCNQDDATKVKHRSELEKIVELIFPDSETSSE